MQQFTNLLDKKMGKKMNKHEMWPVMLKSARNQTVS